VRPAGKRRLPGGVLSALWALLLGTALGGAAVLAQQPAQLVARPVPGPVIPPLAYQRAVARGTRSVDGSPDSRYWRNHASYDIRAELDPAVARVTGSQTVRYTNNFPDTLALLVLHVHLNLHGKVPSGTSVRRSRVV